MKRKLITLLFATIITFSFVSCGNEDTTETTAISESKNIKSKKASNKFGIVNKFIALYNNSSNNISIDNISKMDIHGKDYRTEFRLGAFDNAVGKKGTINDESIYIINYGNSSNDSIRIYAVAKSVDDAIDIYTTTIHILDGSITEQEIKSKYDTSNFDSININFDENTNINGYIERTYSDGKISGYDIMIDCTDLAQIK